MLMLINDYRREVLTVGLAGLGWAGRAAVCIRIFPSLACYLLLRHRNAARCLE